MLNSKCTSELRSAYWFSAYRLDEAQIYKKLLLQHKAPPIKKFQGLHPEPKSFVNIPLHTVELFFAGTNASSLAEVWA